MQKWVAEVTPEKWKNDEYAKTALNPSHWPVVVEKLKTLWTTLPTFSNEALSKITAPALIAAGDHDDIRLEHTVEIARAIPQAQLFIIPGAKHSLKDQPLLLVHTALLNFLLGK